MYSPWGQIILVSESECSICPVYLRFPVIMFVLFLLFVKKDLLGPLYFSLFHPIHMSQVSQKRSSPVRAHVQHKSAFIDCLVSEGPCSGLRDAEENDRASGRGNSGNSALVQSESTVLELLLYSDNQTYEGQSNKIKYCG